ncbi:hypothetical protein QUB33_27075, partial [Microcoleus sp. B3-A4]|uniref:hypothetical protein n=1 Tax=Microcoleus sp. B3-A4 TaxID=2818653 RepID=UPI002FD4FBFD
WHTELTTNFPKPLSVNVWSLIIMTISGDYPQGRSQVFTFPRRELLQKVLSVASLCFVASPQPAAASPSPQPAASPSKRPLPEFNIGDLVAQDWEENDGDEDEEAPESSTDFGEIVGLCYVPEDGSYYPPKTWVYYVYWTRSTSDCCSYPCFDGEPTAGSELRLVSHA